MTEEWGCLQHGKAGQRVIPIQGRAERCGMRCHQATENTVRLKTHEMFISAIFHLIFLDCGLLWVTETAESKTMVKGGYCSW